MLKLKISILTIVYLFTHASPCIAMCKVLTKTKTITATEVAHIYQSSAETARRFSLARYEAQHNTSLMNNYLEQAQTFVNRIAFAPGSLNIAMHFSCFTSPNRLPTTDRISTALLNPILMVQDELGAIMFNRDGSYKGFTSHLDYTLWATIVTDYLKHYFHYQNDTKLQNTMRLLISRNIPGFTYNDLTHEEHSAFEKHKEKHRVEVKYKSSLGYRFQPDIMRHQFNQDLKQYEAFFHAGKHADAKKILKAYTLKISHSRHQNKTCAAQIKLLKKIARQRTSTEPVLDPDEEDNPIDDLSNHLQLDEAFDQIEPILTSLELTKLRYFEANQKAFLKRINNATKQAYIACETGCALDLYTAQALNITSTLTPNAQRRIIPATRGVYEGYQLINNIDTFIDYLTVNFNLSKTAVNQGLAIIESYSTNMDHATQVQLIKQIAGFLMKNISDLRLFLTLAEKEYGHGAAIFNAAYHKSRAACSAECSQEQAQELFAKKIADHTTFKIIHRAIDMNKLLSAHLPKADSCQLDATKAIDFSSVREIAQHIDNIASNQSTMNSYINSNKTIHVQTSMLNALQNLENNLKLGSESYQQFLSQEISSVLEKLHSEIEPLLPQTEDLTIEHLTLDENLLIEMLEQNNINAAEAMLAQETYKSILQGVIENFTHIKSFMIGIIDYAKQLNLLKDPECLSAFLKPDIIDESIALATYECLQAYDTLADNADNIASKSSMRPIYFYISDMITMEILTEIITKSLTHPVACSSQDTRG